MKATPSPVVQQGAVQAPSGGGGLSSLFKTLMGLGGLATGNPMLGGLIPGQDPFVAFLMQMLKGGQNPQQQGTIGGMGGIGTPPFSPYGNPSDYFFQ